MFTPVDFTLDNLCFDSIMAENIPVTCDLAMMGGNTDNCIDVSNFGYNEWRQYDPYCLDVRNPYFGIDEYSDFSDVLIATPCEMFDVMNQDIMSAGMFPDMPSPEDALIATPCEMFDVMNQDIMSAGMFPDEECSDFSDFLIAAPCEMFDVMNQDIMSAGMFPDMLSPEIAHSMGLISDQDYNFLQAMGLTSDQVNQSHSEISCEPSHSSWADAQHEMNVKKLNESDALESERDLAVKHYQDAKQAGDIDEMLKWENVANKKQEEIYTLWDTPRYTPNVKAPGID